jgi:hypothetical protein
MQNGIVPEPAAALRVYARPSLSSPALGGRLLFMHRKELHRTWAPRHSEDRASSKRDTPLTASWRSVPSGRRNRTQRSEVGGQRYFWGGTSRRRGKPKRACTLYIRERLWKGKPVVPTLIVRSPSPNWRNCVSANARASSVRPGKYCNCLEWSPTPSINAGPVAFRRRHLHRLFQQLLYSVERRALRSPSSCAPAFWLVGMPQ